MSTTKEGACAWGKQMPGLPSCCSWIAKTRMGLFEDKVSPDLTIHQIDDHILLLKLLFFHGMNPRFQMPNISMEPATARYRNPLLCLSSLPISGSFARHPVGSSASCKPRCLLENMTLRVNLRMAPLNFWQVFEPQMDWKSFLHGFFSNPTSKSLSSEVSAGILMAVIQSSMGGSESTGRGYPPIIHWMTSWKARIVCI